MKAKDPIDFKVMSKQIRKQRGAVFKRWADRQLSEWNRTHSEALEILKAIENDSTLSQSIKDKYEAEFAEQYRGLMEESEALVRSLLDSLVNRKAGEIRSFRKNKK